MLLFNNLPASAGCRIIKKSDSFSGLGAVGNKTKLKGLQYQAVTIKLGIFENCKESRRFIIFPGEALLPYLAHPGRADLESPYFLPSSPPEQFVLPAGNTGSSRSEDHNYNVGW